MNLGSRNLLLIGTVTVLALLKFDQASHADQALRHEVLAYQIGPKLLSQMLKERASWSDAAPRIFPFLSGWCAMRPTSAECLVGMGVSWLLHKVYFIRVIRSLVAL